MRTCALVATVASLVVLAAPAPAAAGDIEDFQRARDAYDAHDWPRSVLLFEALVGTDPPTMRTPLLVLESRKLLAASYVFVGRLDAARAQLERLLVAEPTYELDDTQFAIEFVELFHSVQAQVEQERERAAERAQAAAALEAERERARALIEFAESEVEVEIESSRWLALVPFGAGQFQNGQDDIGWMFMVIESVAVIGAFVSLFVEQDVQAQLNRAELLHDDHLRSQANDIMRAMQIMNWTSAGLFGVFAVAGIIQAELDFQPARVVRTHREVPATLREGLEVRLRLNGFSISF
jgi:hypothetical protein